MAIVEPHFMAAFIASGVACEVLDLFPDNDLAVELKNLLTVQYDLFCHMMEGKHYGTNDLSNFMAYMDELKKQVAQIKQKY